MKIKNVKSLVFDIFVAIGYGYKIVLGKISKFIRKNVKEIASLLKCLYVALMACMGYSFAEAFIFTIVMMFLCCVIKIAYQKMNEVDENYIPKKKERFTRLNKRGMIEVDKNREMEMIQYLYELEEYLDENT